MKFTISKNTFPSLDHLIEKLARKARKLGVPAPSYTVGADVSVPVYPRDSHGAIVSTLPALYHIACVEIVLDYEPMMLAGWDFVAVVEHLSTGNVVSRCPGHEETEIPANYRTDAPTCDHCGTVRRRIETFIVRDESGTFQRIGRTCLRDFTGHNVAGLAGRLSVWREIYGALTGWSDEDERGAGGRMAILTASFVAWVCLVVEAEGRFYSKKMADTTGCEATANTAWRALHDAKGSPSVENRSKAAELLEWVADTTDTNDYMSNLRVACAEETIRDRRIGLVASVYGAHERALGREVARKAEQATRINEYMGAPGDKFGRKLSSKDKKAGATAHPALTVTLEKIITIEGHYGTSYLHVFRSAEGHTLKWFGSEDAAYDLRWSYETVGQSLRGNDITQSVECFPVGSTFEIAATVKACDEYKGTKQTVLTRVKRLTPALDSDALKARRVADAVELEAVKAEIAATFTELKACVNVAHVEIINACSYYVTFNDGTERAMGQTCAERLIKNDAGLRAMSDTDHEMAKVIKTNTEGLITVSKDAAGTWYLHVGDRAATPATVEEVTGIFNAYRIKGGRLAGVSA